MALLSDNEVRERLDRRLQVRRHGFQAAFESFPAAISFVNRVADLAEKADHHPDIDIRYDRVRLRLSTHSEGGLTRRDFDLAAQIDSGSG